MAFEPVEVRTLAQARAELIAAAHARTDGDVCELLLSVEHRSSVWRWLDLPAHVADRPRIRWMLSTLRKRPTAKREVEHRELTGTLQRIGNKHCTNSSLSRCIVDTTWNFGNTLRDEARVYGLDRASAPISCCSTAISLRSRHRRAGRQSCSRFWIGGNRVYVCNH